MKKDIKIIIAAHKECGVPRDEMYLPLHVGAEGKRNPDGTPLDFGFAKDNTGDNISWLNPYFSELTGLYWAWKNLEADYIGLVHYRRMFSGSHPDRNDISGSAITSQQLAPMLDRYRVFVPKKRRYYIETLASHYSHTHDGLHLKICRCIIERRHPEYLDSYDRVLKRSWGYMFNMMILPRDLLDEYCSWLFDILFILFKNVDHENMTAFEKRFPGRMSEILFNVWLDYEIQAGKIRKNEVRELNYVEDVDWSQKIRSFLAAKFLNRKYGGSSQTHSGQADSGSQKGR